MVEGKVSSRGIVLLGGGGHCKSVIDSLLRNGSYFSENSIVIVDPSLEIGDVVSGCRVIGSDDYLTELFAHGYKEAFITLGSIKNVYKRRELFCTANEIGFSFTIVVDKDSVIAEDVVISMGVYVSRGAIINTGSRINECAIINTGAIIEHDCKIGAFSHIAVGAVLCGGVEIEDDVLIGANATVVNGVKIGRGSLIGAGSTILSDVPENTTAVGVWKG